MGQFTRLPGRNDPVDWLGCFNLVTGRCCLRTLHFLQSRPASNLQSSLVSGDFQRLPGQPANSHSRPLLTTLPFLNLLHQQLEAKHQDSGTGGEKARSDSGTNGSGRYSGPVQVFNSSPSQHDTTSASSAISSCITCRHAPQGEWADSPGV